MAVTREEVIWAYRMFLGREPESEAAIALKKSLANLKTLRADLLNSPEFLQTSPIIPVGLHLNVTEDHIDIGCTPEQRQQMLDRIAAAWRSFGTQDPYWSVLTADQFRKNEIDKSLDSFYATGEIVADELFALLQRNAIDPGSLSRVLDFGCGVGRLTLALARRFSHVSGVDISPPHLQLADDRAKKQGITNVDFIALDSISGLDRLPECDLLFSRIVLQHNPPPVIAILLRQLLGHVASGGYAVFQVPTFIEGFTFDPKVYLASDQAQMEMNALPQRHIFAISAQQGFLPVEVREDLDAGDPRMVSQTFLFRRR